MTQKQPGAQALSSAMTSKVRPYPYQIQAVEATLDALFNMQDKNPLVVMPTGTGKSNVISWTMRAIMQRLPHVRMINVAHVKELVAQNSSEMQRVWPSAPFGIYAAGLKRKQATMPITFASIQSAIKDVSAFGKQNVLCIDEAHLLSPEADTSYQRFIAALREKNPKMPVIGYSATPWRLRHGHLMNGNLFNHIAFDNSQRNEFVKLIDEGYLCPLIPKSMSFQFDVTKVRKIGGDFNQSELQSVVNVDSLTEQALHEALQCAPDRQHWMIFCSGINHVENVTGMLEALGESAVAVHSKMPETERDLNIARFKDGNARMIVSEGILTTGFNAKFVDCIVLLRPTTSPGLHVQILGRGTRTFFGNGITQYASDTFIDQWGNNLETVDGRLQSIAMSEKQNCLVLDFAGNTQRLGPVNDPRIPKERGKGTGEIPVKICPKCNSYVHAAQRYCDGLNWDGTKCNHMFEFSTKLEQTAATAELIVRDVAPICAWFTVERVEYDVYTRPFSPPMMRVKYYCGIRRFIEHVCIEHQSYAGKKARDWWRARLKVSGYPDTVSPPPTTAAGMAEVHKLKTPTNIYVHVNSEYKNIIATSFDGTTPVSEVVKYGKGT